MIQIAAFIIIAGVLGSMLLPILSTIIFAVGFIVIILAALAGLDWFTIEVDDDAT